MKILGIETSCDETAVSLLECDGDPRSGTFSMHILGNALYSQIDMHKEFGGVVPNVAKREHAKNLIPLFKKCMEKQIPLAPFLKGETTLDSLPFDKGGLRGISEIFGREKDFYNEFVEFIKTIEKPDIDVIAVTEGPGLEPALWMGIIFARALGFVFDIPVIPTNHMEGHILSVLPQEITFPALALLISGGHTELILMPDWDQYQIIGQTRDDAIGEAFDKVARLLHLPYPGGPEISKLAEIQRTSLTPYDYKLPRPMIHSKDYDFSFSGIKTAVLYSLSTPMGTIGGKEVVAREFEDAVTEVLISKTFRAVEEFDIKTLILGGGVVSNNFIRQNFEEKIKEYPSTTLLLPTPEMRTDNALMIALAGYVKYLNKQDHEAPRAQGNLSLQK